MKNNENTETDSEAKADSSPSPCSVVVLSDSANYDYSKDYELLFHGMKKVSAICIVDSHGCRDVCSTIYYDGIWQISSRGVCHLRSKNFESFKHRCEEINLTYLEPMFFETGCRLVRDGIISPNVKIHESIRGVILPTTTN